MLLWQGKLEEAIELYKKAIAIRIKVQGADHPDIAANYSNLGLVYKQQVGPVTMLEPHRTRAVCVASWQGKLEEAIGLYKKATAIDLKIRGPDHPKLAIRYNNLAPVYKQQVL